MIPLTIKATAQGRVIVKRRKQKHGFESITWTVFYVGSGWICCYFDTGTGTWTPEQNGDEYATQSEAEQHLGTLEE